MKHCEPSVSEEQEAVKKVAMQGGLSEPCYFTMVLRNNPNQDHLVLEHQVFDFKLFKELKQSDINNEVQGSFTTDSIVGKHHLILYRDRHLIYAWLSFHHAVTGIGSRSG